MRNFTIYTIAISLSLCAFSWITPTEIITKSICQIRSNTSKIDNYIDKWCEKPYTYCDYRF